VASVRSANYKLWIWNPFENRPQVRGCCKWSFADAMEWIKIKKLFWLVRSGGGMRIYLSAINSFTCLPSPLSSSAIRTNLKENTFLNSVWHLQPLDSADWPPIVASNSGRGSLCFYCPLGQIRRFQRFYCSLPRPWYMIARVSKKKKKKKKNFIREWEKYLRNSFTRGADVIKERWQLVLRFKDLLVKPGCPIR
jgi:hypothetical protein